MERNMHPNPGLELGPEHSCSLSLPGQPAPSPLLIIQCNGPSAMPLPTLHSCISCCGEERGMERAHRTGNMGDRGSDLPFQHLSKRAIRQPLAAA